MIVSIFAIIILLIVLTFVWPPDSPWSPWWRTSRSVARSACRLAKVTKKDIVFELGSGDGEFILTASGEYGCKKAVGIEIDYTRYFISKMRKRLEKADKAEFIRKDFKKVNLNNSTVVYFYLVPKVIKRIMPKLKRELRPGTRIVSYRYKVPLKLLSNHNGLYLYKI